MALGEREWLLNDGRIQNPSNPFGSVPLSNFVQRGFGFVYHSIAILDHQVPNLSITIRNFFIAGTRGGGAGPRGWVRYSDEKVANRDIRVWHFVIENGY